MTRWMTSPGVFVALAFAAAAPFFQAKQAKAEAPSQGAPARSAEGAPEVGAEEGVRLSAAVRRLRDALPHDVPALPARGRGVPVLNAHVGDPFSFSFRSPPWRANILIDHYDKSGTVAHLDLLGSRSYRDVPPNTTLTVPDGYQLTFTEPAGIDLLVVLAVPETIRRPEDEVFEATGRYLGRLEALARAGEEGGGDDTRVEMEMLFIAITNPFDPAARAPGSPRPDLADGIAAASQLSDLVSLGLLGAELVSAVERVRDALAIARSAGEVSEIIAIAKAMGLDGASIAYLGERALTDSRILLLESLVNDVIDAFYPPDAKVPPSVAKLWIGLAIDGLQGDMKDIVLDPILLVAEEMVALEDTTTRVEQSFIDGAVSLVALLEADPTRHDLVRSWAALAEETAALFRDGWMDWPSETDAAHKIEIVRRLLLYRVGRVAPGAVDAPTAAEIEAFLLSIETPRINMSAGYDWHSMDREYRDFAGAVADALDITLREQRPMGVASSP